jgi:hypothetical protein
MLKQSLTYLPEAALIHRAESGTDARRFALTATATGLPLCPKADPLSLELEALMLTARQRRELLGAMRRVLAWVGDGYCDAVRQRLREAAA